MDLIKRAEFDIIEF